MQPRIIAPLDADFSPVILFNRACLAATKASSQSVPLVIALERENNAVSRLETLIRKPGLQDDSDTLQFVERLVKFLIWARGGWKLYIGTPQEIGQQIARRYSKHGARAFDADMMCRSYEKPFEVVVTAAENVPAERETGAALGGHLDGCRIGFDLGASDYKIAAVVNGETVFSDELPWNPCEQTDPTYHYDKLNYGLKKAAAHLPRVDAIGGSSAGIIVSNKIMIASLFRGVPSNRFEKEVKPLFLRLQQEWQVPLEVANDGDVTALAGAMSLNANGVLGIAMGSSEAAGFLDPQGRIKGWLNELAFAPVDLNPRATVDEWSGDRGVGAQYFSQQAVNKLLPAAGITFPPEMKLPERLKATQELMTKNDPRARRIFETIGVYLGYTIPLYADFYDCSHMLILGRVTSGKGGDIILEKARAVLETEFPEVAARIALHVPDEKSRRVGQAVAAASLPIIKK